MSKRTYFPERGDLIDVNFFPSAGREIDKRRPAIVLSPLGYNRIRGLCVAVPLSSNLTPGPFWIPAPAGLTTLPSMILCDYVRSLDFRERGAAFLKKADRDTVDRVVEVIMDLLDPTLTA